MFIYQQINIDYLLIRLTDLGSLELLPLCEGDATQQIAVLRLSGRSLR